MSKLKNKILDWLAKFLPAYAKDQYQNEIERLKEEIQTKESVILQQSAYINGIERALRSKQVIIKSEVK